MRKLRVLHVNKLYAPWIGGVEGAVQAIVEETVSSFDVDAQVLACRCRGRSTLDTVNGIPILRVGSLGIFLSTPVAPSFPSVLRAMRREFDIVHLHVPFPLPIVAGWRRRSSEPRLVIHYHCDLSRPIQRALLRLLAPWNRTMFEYADRIIVTSERLLRSSPALSPYADKCRVIPLPTSPVGAPKASSAHRDAVLKRLGAAPGQRVVLFVGRLVYYKGLPYLLAAMTGLDALLVIVGEGPMRTFLERRAAALRISDRVRFVGTLPPDDLRVTYQIADVFVLPSIASAEAFGLVQLEAMQNGCPVVNTDLPTGVPSVSIHQLTGLTVPPGDSPAMANAINTILLDKTLRARMSQCARTRATEFDRTLIARRVMNVYEEALAPRTESPPTPILTSALS